MRQAQNTSGIILAGGSSTRLGQDKALIEIRGEPLIQRVVSTLNTLVDEIVLVTNRPQTLDFLGLPMTRDVYRGVGTLGGLYAGLSAIQTTYGLVVGCDMPFLNADLLRYMILLCQDSVLGYDVVMPHVDKYFEPLHAIYARHCRHTFEKHIVSKQYRVRYACEGMRIRYVGKQEIEHYDPERLSFFNVNTPSDLERMWAILWTRRSSAKDA